MSRSSPLLTLAHVIAGDAKLADWQRRSARDQAIVRIVRQALPQSFAAEVVVADAQSGELKLGAPSGAVAATLRLRSIDIRSALVREGWEFTAIKVIVQPRNSPEKRPQSLKIQWDARAKQPLAGLRDQLPPGPLKTAVARLLRGR